MQLRRLLGVTLVLITGLCVIPPPGHSSILVAPGATPEDGPLGSNVVALPLNAASALFHNPAHITVLPPSLSFGPGGLTLHPSYANEQGYDNTSREVPMGGNFGYISDRWAPLRVGIGVFGSVGFTFNFDADPEHGVSGQLFSEGAVISVPLALAYPLTPQLHIGVALNPTYGRARFKSPSPVGRLDIDVRGPGVFGTVGVLYTPTANLSLGIGIKTPGTTWMFGNARVGGQGDDATLDFQLPTVVSFGAAFGLSRS